MKYKENAKVMTMLLDITIDNPDMDDAKCANELMKFENEKDLLELG